MKVVSVVGRRFEDTVNKNIVEILEDWLQDARDGRLRAVAIAGVLEGNQGCADQYSINGCMPALIGATSLLHARLVQEKLENPNCDH